MVTFNPGFPFPQGGGTNIIPFINPVTIPPAPFTLPSFNGQGGLFPGVINPGFPIPRGGPTGVIPFIDPVTIPPAPFILPSFNGQGGLFPGVINPGFPFPQNTGGGSSFPIQNGLVNNLGPFGGFFGFGGGGFGGFRPGLQIGI